MPFSYLNLNNRMILFYVPPRAFHVILATPIATAPGSISYYPPSSCPAFPPVLLPLVFELAFPLPLEDVLVFLAAVVCARAAKPWGILSPPRLA